MEDKINKIVEKLIEYSTENTSGMLIVKGNLYIIVKNYYELKPTEKINDFFLKLMEKHEANFDGFLIKESDFMCAINKIENENS